MNVFEPRSIQCIHVTRTMTIIIIIITLLFCMAAWGWCCVMLCVEQSTLHRNSRALCCVLHRAYGRLNAIRAVSFVCASTTKMPYPQTLPRAPTKRDSSLDGRSILADYIAICIYGAGKWAHGVCVRSVSENSQLIILTKAIRCRAQCVQSSNGLHEPSTDR